MNTIYHLDDNSTKSEKIKNKGLEFVKQQSGENHINATVNSTKTPKESYISLKTDSQISGMNPESNKRLMESVLLVQKSDGSFTGEPYQDIEILKGIALYYNKIILLI